MLYLLKPLRSAVTVLKFQIAKKSKAAITYRGGGMKSGARFTNIPKTFPEIESMICISYE